MTKEYVVDADLVALSHRVDTALRRELATRRRPGNEDHERAVNELVFILRELQDLRVPAGTRVDFLVATAMRERLVQAVVDGVAAAVKKGLCIRFVGA